jgi:hypothetical protein
MSTKQLSGCEMRLQISAILEWSAIGGERVERELQTWPLLRKQQNRCNILRAQNREIEKNGPSLIALTAINGMFQSE